MSIGLYSPSYPSSSGAGAFVSVTTSEGTPVVGLEEDHFRLFTLGGNTLNVSPIYDVKFEEPHDAKTTPHLPRGLYVFAFETLLWFPLDGERLVLVQLDRPEIKVPTGAGTATFPRLRGQAIGSISIHAETSEQP